MRVADFSPELLRTGGAGLGIAFGFAAARLADVLPKRAGLSHLTTGARQKRRNAVLVFLGAASGAGLAHLCTGFPEAPASLTAFWLVTSLVLVAMLLAAAAIDIEHMELPNELTLGGAILGLGLAPFRPLGMTSALVGVLVAAILAIVPAMVYGKLRGHGGAGLGDTKLALCAGAWFGMEGALFVIAAGALQSVIAAVWMRLFGLSFSVPESVTAQITALRERARDGDAEAIELLGDDPMALDVDDRLRNMRLPLGPFLVLACLEFLFFKTSILSLFEKAFAP